MYEVIKERDDTRKQEVTVDGQAPQWKAAKRAQTSYDPASVTSFTSLDIIQDTGFNLKGQVGMIIGGGQGWKNYTL